MGNAVPRTVIVFMPSDDCTVKIAFPAYIGRVNATMPRQSVDHDTRIGRKGFVTHYPRLECL